MMPNVAEARSRGPWHLLPPVTSVVLGLGAGLYGVLAVLFADWARAHAGAGPYPALIWAEFVGLPFLIGALYLVAGIGIWRARIRRRAFGQGAAERRCG